MNSLEFINKEIAITKSKYKEHINFNQTSFGIKDEKKLQTLQRIKTELEIIEIIKLGCTGLKYNSDGGSVIKLGNINAMNFIKLSNRLDEICDWRDEVNENE